MVHEPWLMSFLGYPKAMRSPIEPWFRGEYFVSLLFAIDRFQDSYQIACQSYLYVTGDCHPPPPPPASQLPLIEHVPRLDAVYP